MHRVTTAAERSAAKNTPKDLCNKVCRSGTSVDFVWGRTCFVGGAEYVSHMYMTYLYGLLDLFLIGFVVKRSINTESPSHQW